MIVRSFLLGLNLRGVRTYLEFLLAHGAHFLFQEPLFDALAVEYMFAWKFIDLLVLFEVLVAN